MIRRAVEETAAARSAAGLASPTSVSSTRALGPHTARVTGYRTVVNRVGANDNGNLSSISVPSAGRSRRHWPSAPPAPPRNTVRAMAKALRDRAPRPAAARRGLPAGASR